MHEKIMRHELERNANASLQDEPTCMEKQRIIHFDELKKLYPDAHFPKFSIERLAREHIVIEYASSRNLPYFVYGLIQGCLHYFHDTSSLRMITTKRHKSIEGAEYPIYRFEVRRDG